MTDPLKTFLERARDGGWERADMFTVEGGLAFKNEGYVPAPEIIFNPEAAKAVWGEEELTDISIVTDRNSNTAEVVRQPNRRTVRRWLFKQHQILSHIQNGESPIEALEKEL